MVDWKIIVIGLIGVIVIAAVFNPQSASVLTNNLLFLAVFGGIALFGYAIYKYLTRKPVFQPVATAKKNLIQTGRMAKTRLGHLYTLGDANIPVIDWGQIEGYVANLQVANLPVKSWTVFIVSKRFPHSLWSEPDVVFIPTHEHSKLEEGQHIYIRAHSLIAYGKFLFPNTLFGSPVPLKLQQELVGYQMFVKLLDETGEIVERAIFSDSEHQRAIEKKKLTKVIEETGEEEQGS